MAHPPADDDAQRTLERHALRNVQALARRLGYSDALDKYGDRFGVICIAVVVFMVVSAVAIAMLVNRPDPRAIELQRCHVDMVVTVMWEFRNELKAANPAFTAAQLQDRVRVTSNDVKQEAADRCARIKPPG
jgi:hypothetical protein